MYIYFRISFTGAAFINDLCMQSKGTTYFLDAIDPDTFYRGSGGGGSERRDTRIGVIIHITGVC